MILSLLAAAAAPIQFTSLGLDPVAIAIGPISIKWYSLAYLAGILLGYWYLTVLLRQPGAPMARRHADDFIFYATLGIILGGRLGYVLFYDQKILLHPLDVFKLWQGGMSLHGGTLGVLFAIWWMTRREKLSFLRFCDYIACVVPFGLGLVRVANFVNGELWGKVTTLPWAMVFPDSPQPLMPRHPSQLYEAFLEGPVMFAIMAFFFWKTRARYEPGKLFGIAAISYGLFRFGVEFVRESDVQLMEFAARTGLHMGQWLTLPMILGGLYLVATAKKRTAPPLPATPAAGEGSAA
ncbi:MAG: prolipoprotein diacylglyceryl transferase [Sphingobium sp.]|nr:prolipoprotein diacylglyceryl transferase [Sphingobium sp.]